MNKHLSYDFAFDIIFYVTIIMNVMGFWFRYNYTLEMIILYCGGMYFFYFTTNTGQT